MRAEGGLASGVTGPAEMSITDWPVPAGTPSLLFGGSFDPIHRAHVRLAVAVRDALFGEVGHLVFVPAARSPHKAGRAPADAAHRIRMIELAIEGAPRVHVWTDEVERAAAGESSYWVQTLRRARAKVGSAPLRFLIGADQAVAFHRWREPEAIVRLAEPAVVLREPCSTSGALAAALRAEGRDEAEITRWLARVVETALFEASSTAAREAVRSEGEAGAQLDPAVAAYIARHGLYTSAD